MAAEDDLAALKAAVSAVVAAGTVMGKPGSGTVLVPEIEWRKVCDLAAVPMTAGELTN